MGRKPTVNLNLPKGMRRRKQRSGKVYYYYDAGGKPRNELPLGDNYTEAIRKWAELEMAKVPKFAKPDYKVARDRYVMEVIPKKSHRTQLNNLGELKQLDNFFGNPPAPLDEIEPHHFAKYMEWRSSVPVAANREKALFSHMWNMWRSWGLTSQPNPCAGIKGFREKGRKDVYIEDAIADVVYKHACQSLKDSLDLAYFTGQRPADVLKMCETDIAGELLWIVQNKTDKKIRIKIQGALKSLILRITMRKELLNSKTKKLLINEKGEALSKNMLRNRFDKARDEAIKAQPELAQKIRQYQFRDLRAKAGTDKGNREEAQRLLGHTSMTMTEHYLRDRAGDIVTPTK
ncbi:tyrosine-type recombinase/integrase [Chromobacterium vaccinii]|uniref:tyrosine-type recombinase/integrase n=1 Tax=Chromobacterium vaccinii TaxID=1108595 RepID=UPI003260D69F